MILDRILETKRTELVSARAAMTESALRDAPAYTAERKGFTRALQAQGSRRIIAEVKRASPSKGVIRENFDPPAHAAAYEAAGAACVSVLTDRDYFQGDLDHLRAARAACGLPIIRKDFTIDAYQIVEARSAGADAVLLIVAALDRTLLGELHEAAVSEGLDVLVEVHDEDELAVALDLGASLVGINNRNLKTFETSLDVTRRLLEGIPDGVTVISESGLKSPSELDDLESRGVAGFLIGETFMAAPDPGAELAKFLRS